jgi:hypothetical protein
MQATPVQANLLPALNRNNISMPIAAMAKAEATIASNIDRYM